MGYYIKCTACGYCFAFMDGVGKRYSPEIVFYKGRNREPLLLSLVENKRIKDTVIRLLSEGAKPVSGYGHALYECPQCNQLENYFYFKLGTSTEQYEPDYHCTKCAAELRRLNFAKKTNRQSVFVDVNNLDVKLKCPECGLEKLALYFTSFWD